MSNKHLIRQLKDKYEITIYCYKDPQAKNYLPGVRAIQLPRFGQGSIGVFPYFLLCYLHMLFFGKYDIVHLRKIDSSFFLPRYLFVFVSWVILNLPFQFQVC